MKKENFIIVRKIAELVHDIGGTTYYVGGYVRDKLLGKKNKDIDIEVHGLTSEQLYNVLKNVGEPITVGNSFGIYSLRHYDIDISLPRKENDSGRGKNGITECIDPFIGTRKSALRRDLTMNSIMEDVLTGKIIDHFGGVDDIKNGVIRYVDERTFLEDPLRVLRVAQFSARFNFVVADETIELSRKISLDNIPRERVLGELEKALLKANQPSIFFEVLRKMNQLGTFFPEVERLIGVEQDPIHHPEGDVWNHTMLVLDAAAQMRDGASYPFGFMLSALCHDFGKSVTTEVINNKIHSYQHEIAGVDIASGFIERLTNAAKLKKYVLNMVKLHMRPNQLATQNSSEKSMCRMFDASVSCKDLLLLAKADHCSRPDAKGYKDLENVLNHNLEIYLERISQPQVLGQDLIDAGFSPDKDFKETLEYAHKLLLSGVNKETALKHTVAYIRKIREVQ